MSVLFSKGFPGSFVFLGLASLVLLLGFGCVSVGSCHVLHLQFCSDIPFLQFYCALRGSLSVIFDRPRTHHPDGALDPEQAPKASSTTWAGRCSKLNQVGQFRDLMNRTY